MKIYVVTSGCYSDYHIDAVFTKEKQAQMYANLDSDREVEEYEADEIDVKSNITERIWYDPIINGIVCMNPIFTHMRDTISGNQYIFSLKVSGKLKKDVETYGIKSQLLLKTAQDRWSQYKAEHMDEVAEEMDDEEEVITISPEQGVNAFAKYVTMFNTGKVGDKHEDNK